MVAEARLDQDAEVVLDLLLVTPLRASDVAWKCAWPYLRTHTVLVHLHTQGLVDQRSDGYWSVRE